MTLYQIFRDAYERAKSPTATTDSCERAGVNAVMRQMIHTCADMCESARKKTKGESGKEILAELTAAECAAFLRSITEK
jgi:hypothetical protein